jgi:nucleotidyltransferase/DNA polymerase involved in DNA repair
LGDEYPVCGIYPLGPAEIPCPDFAEVTEQCEPLGAAYYDGELVLQPEHYLTEYGQQIRETVLQWTRIPVSIGIAPTKTLSKVANHLAKRSCDGVFLLPDFTDTILD